MYKQKPKLFDGPNAVGESGVRGLEIVDRDILPYATHYAGNGVRSRRDGEFTSVEVDKPEKPDEPEYRIVHGFLHYSDVIPSNVEAYEPSGKVDNQYHVTAYSWSGEPPYFEMNQLWFDYRNQIFAPFEFKLETYASAFLTKYVGNGFVLLVGNDFTFEYQSLTDWVWPVLHDIYSKSTVEILASTLVAQYETKPVAHTNFMEQTFYGVAKRPSYYWSIDVLTLDPQSQEWDAHFGSSTPASKYRRVQDAIASAATGYSADSGGYHFFLAVARTSELSSANTRWDAITAKQGDFETKNAPIVFFGNTNSLTINSYSPTLYSILSSVDYKKYMISSMFVLGPGAVGFFYTCGLYTEDTQALTDYRITTGYNQAENMLTFAFTSNNGASWTEIDMGTYITTNPTYYLDKAIAIGGNILATQFRHSYVEGAIGAYIGNGKSLILLFPYKYSQYVHPFSTADAYSAAVLEFDISTGLFTDVNCYYTDNSFMSLYLPRTAFGFYTTDSTVFADPGWIDVDGVAVEPSDTQVVGGNTYNCGDSPGIGVCYAGINYGGHQWGFGKGCAAFPYGWKNKASLIYTHDSGVSWSVVAFEDILPTGSFVSELDWSLPKKAAAHLFFSAMFVTLVPRKYSDQGVLINKGELLLFAVNMDTNKVEVYTTDGSFSSVRKRFSFKDKTAAGNLDRFVANFAYTGDRTKEYYPPHVIPAHPSEFDGPTP